MKKLISLLLLVGFLTACSPRYEKVPITWIKPKHKPLDTSKPYKHKKGK